MQQFERADVEEIFKVADRMRPFAGRERITRVLEGAILSNMFFEPSTRTRVSFGSAFNLLGGNVRETTGIESSSIVKGESMRDFARVLSGYSDIIVIRHPETGSAEEFASASLVPVINGGDGANEHPSQALLDLYTIRKELESQNKSVDDFRIALIGDLANGRAVHSLLKLLTLFKKVTVQLASPEGLDAPPELIELLRQGGASVSEFHDLREGIQHVDILYVTRVQEERFPTQDEANYYPRSIPLEPGNLFAVLRIEHGDHASTTARLACAKSGARRRPGFEPEPGHLSPNAERCAHPHGIVYVDLRRRE